MRDSHKTCVGDGWGVCFTNHYLDYALLENGFLMMPLEEKRSGCL